VFAQWYAATIGHNGPVIEQGLPALLAGFAAGLAIAMPLGAIGVLILRESILNGLRHGAAAGSGVAFIDLIYCTLAVSVGVAFAPVIRSWGAVPAVISGLVLIGLGLYQLVQARSKVAAEPVDVPKHAVFWRFVALTAINPATLLYFLALASVVTTTASSWVAPVAFVVGTGTASLAWQLGLAVVGARVGAMLPQRVVGMLGWVASGVIIVLGISVIVAGFAAAPMASG
jgi:threonine/homoserine/homoserine lactone efflux protein